MLSMEDHRNYQKKRLSRKEDNEMQSKRFLNDMFAQLAEDFGLETILEQNDIEEWQIIELLYQRGLLDLDDYTYTELELDGED
jgi:hypothetical protein